MTAQGRAGNIVRLREWLRAAGEIRGNEGDTGRKWQREEGTEQQTQKEQYRQAIDRKGRIRKSKIAKRGESAELAEEL